MRLRESLNRKTACVFRGEEHISTKLVKKKKRGGGEYFWQWEQV